MHWQQLFDRAESYEVTVDTICNTLGARRDTD